MRKLVLAISVLAVLVLSVAGLKPRLTSAGSRVHAEKHRARAARRAQAPGASQQVTRQRKPHVVAVKPQGIPGSSGLIAIPEGTDDKQLINNGGPTYVIPVKNTSTTNTITVSSVTVDNTAAYTVSSNCGTLAPGGSCTVSVNFNVASLCEDQFATISLANNDPNLGGAPLTIDIFDGFGRDSHFTIKNLTDPTLTPTALASQLAGSGVSVSNVTYTGAAVAGGNFTTDTNILGFNSGIILSTGSVRSVAGPNCTDDIDTENQTAGDPDLDAILGAPGDSHDAAVLEFDFVPNTSVVSFQYVFASDEYNEFVGEFNDVFAFFVNGTNIALIPGTTTPVSINNVNLNANSQFYINNDFPFPGTAPVDTEMDGLTVVLTATANVNANQTNHIKLAIADAFDDALDSNVFIAAGSLTSSAVTLSPGSLSFGTQAVGTTSASQAVTLSNAGAAVVNVSGISTSSGFTQTNNCPASLNPAGQTGSSCTINVSFAPEGAGAFNGSLTVMDDSPTAGSQQAVSLTGTGTTSATLVSIAVTPANPTISTGTTQQFTATGTFSDGSTQDLTTSVTWSSSNTDAATISNAPGSQGLATAAPVTTQQTTTITATSTTAEVSGSTTLTVIVSPIVITVAPPPPGQPPVPTINPGGQAAYGLILNAVPGFTGTVTLGCTATTLAGAPAPSVTCSPDPNTVTIQAGGSTEVAIVLNTFCAGTTTALNLPFAGGPTSGLALLLGALAMGCLAWTYRRRPRWVLKFAAFALVAYAAAGCGSLAKGPAGPTPAGTYNLTITFTVNGQTFTGPTVQLIVT